MSVTGGPIDTLERLGVHGPTVVAEKQTKSDIIVRVQTDSEGKLSFY